MSIKSRLVLGATGLVLLCGASLSLAQQLGFCVNNPGGFPVGTVSLLTTTAGPVSILVSNETSACASVPSTVTSAIIHGQEVVRPNTGRITLPSGLAVGVRWVGTSYIEVFDLSEMNLGR